MEEGTVLELSLKTFAILEKILLKPKNLDFISNINTLVHMVDKIGGLTVLPELAVSQLSDGQKKKFIVSKAFPK